MSLSLTQYISYLEWADTKISEILEDIPEGKLNKSYEGTKSIHARLQHLLEEFMAWYYDALGQDWDDKFQEVKNYSSKQIMSKIKEYHNSWKSLVELKQENEIITTQEGEGLIVKVEFEEIVFNLVNHASYHRGQIATMLKLHDKSAPITDYYWYKIKLLTET